MKPETLSHSLLNNRFQVKRALGRGAMGRVYLVSDLLANDSTAPDLALKFIPIGARFSEFIDYFKHEFRTLKKLRHPNVANVHDFGQIDETGEYFFTSEWVDGIDLLEITETLPWDDLIAILVQTCRGLEYVHSRGIIHYDIKPSNILIRQYKDRDDEARFEVKLIDFGLAEDRHRGRAPDVIKGTVSYLAPEVAKSALIDKRADLYSLGISLYQCVTRQLPFTGKTNLDIIRKHLHERPRQPSALRPDIPPALEKIILKLLEKDPSSRFSSANQVIRFINRSMSASFVIETKATTESYIYTGRFVGRAKALNRLRTIFEQQFGVTTDALAEAPDEASQTSPDESEPLLSLDPAPSTSSLDDRTDLASPRSREEGWSSSSGSSIAARRPPKSHASSPPADSDSSVAIKTSDELAAASPAINLVLVSGEGGIGKSRLMDEFKNIVQLSAVEIHEGACIREVGRAYQPFVDILRRLLMIHGSEGPGRQQDLDASGEEVEPLLSRFGPGIAKLVPDLLGVTTMPTAAALDPEADRLRLLDHVSRFLIELSCSRPMVLYLNDLHWADQPTIDLLVFLVRQLLLGAWLEPKLLVVGSFRPSEAESGALSSSLVDLFAQSSVDHVSLEPLDRADVRRLIMSMLGVEEQDDLTEPPPAPPGETPSWRSELEPASDLGDEPVSSATNEALRRAMLARRIYEETKGNPFFIEEAMKSLLEKGVLSVRAGQWHTTEDVASLTLPGNVKDVIRDRVERLGAEEVELLKWVAATHRPVTISELERLASRRRAESLPTLKRLVDKQILRKGAPDEIVAYDFAHDLSRQAIYEQIKPGRAVEMHRHIAEVLEDLARRGQRPEDPGELADHFERAQDRPRALDYCVRAGELNRSLHANADAIRYYEKALALLEELAGEHRRIPEICERLADVREVIGKYDAAAELYSRILRDARGTLSPHDTARIQRKLGSIHERQGRYDQALDAFRSCIGSVAGSQEDAKLRAATASVLLKTADLPDQDRYHEALRWADSARQIIASYPETAEVAPIYEMLGLTHAKAGEKQLAEMNFQRALDIHLKADNKIGIASSLRRLGAQAAERGNHSIAIKRYDRALEIVEAIGHLPGIGATAGLLGDVHQALGDYNQARRSHGKALAIHKRIGDREGRARALNRLGSIYLGMGRHARALRYLEESRGLCEAMEERDELAFALAALGRLYTTTGAFDRAEVCVSEALGEAMLLDPRDPEHERSASGLKAHCYFALGTLRCAQGDLDQAEPYLLYALQYFERIGARYDVAKTHIEIAQLLIDVDLDRARDVIKTAEPHVVSLGVEELDVALQLVRGLSRIASDPTGAQQDLISARAGARRLDTPEVLWRASYALAMARMAVGNLQHAASACIEALETLRKIHDELPRSLRGCYLSDPRRQAVRRTFAGLRQSMVAKS